VGLLTIELQQTGGPYAGSDQYVAPGRRLLNSFVRRTEHSAPMLTPRKRNTSIAVQAGRITQTPRSHPDNYRSEECCPSFDDGTHHEGLHEAGHRRCCAQHRRSKTSVRACPFEHNSCPPHTFEKCVILREKQWPRRDSNPHFPFGKKEFKFQAK